MEQGLKIKNSVFVDHRGTFAPLSLSSLDKDWIQSNISFNPKKNTFRGLHFQIGGYEQSKLIKVITGIIVDFIVDIRKDSPNYLKVYEYVLNPGEELYVPRGFAHGFLTIEENTVVQYLVDNIYSPENEGSIHWKLFPEIVTSITRHQNGILSEDDIIISNKDLVTKNF